jgi:ATP synthase protein I
MISRETIRLVGQLSTAGLAFVFAIVLGFGGGYLLDRWLGTEPWLALAGFVLGVAAGVMNVYRILQASTRGGGRRDG